MRNSINFPTRLYDITSGMTHSQLGRVYTMMDNIWHDTENMVPFHHWTCSTNHMDDGDENIVKIDDNGSFPIPILAQPDLTISSGTGKITNKSISMNFNYMSSDSQTYENYNYEEFGLKFNSCTITFWLKMIEFSEEPKNPYCIIENNCGGSAIFRIEYDITTSPTKFIFSYGIMGDYIEYNLPSNVDIYDWNHFIFGIDVLTPIGSGSTGEYLCYINGKYQGERAYPVNVIDPNKPSVYFSPNNQWNLGTSVDTKYYANWQIEDIRFYLRALTPHEVGYIYNQGQGTFNQSYCNGYPTFKYPKYWFKCQDRYYITGDLITPSQCINITGTYSSLYAESNGLVVAQTGQIERIPEFVENFDNEGSYCWTIEATKESYSGVYCPNAYITGSYSNFQRTNYSFSFWLKIDPTADTDIVIVGNTANVTPTYTGDVCIYYDASDDKVKFSYGYGGINYQLNLYLVNNNNWNYYAVSVKTYDNTDNKKDRLTNCFNSDIFDTGLYWNYQLTGSTAPLSRSLFILYTESPHDTSLSLQDLRIFDYAIEYDEMINIYNEQKGILF